MDQSFVGGSFRKPSLLELVVRAMAIILAAIFLTLFAPGLIAAKDHVFYDDGVRANLRSPSAVLALKGYEEQKKRLSESIAILHRNLDSLDDASQQKEFDFYLHLLEERQQEIARLQPPIFTIGFFLSPQMLLWPAIYASLGCLVFCFQRSKRRLTGWEKLRLLPLGIFVYIYYEWPMWVRNFALGSHGRSVYAYTNYDIDPKSFFAQECMIAGFAFLIAAVWLRWSDLAADQDEDNRANSEASYLSPQFISLLQQTFYRWMVSSFVLGLGFVYFTTFFWSLVAKYHDERYIVSAFLAHSLWVLTWIFISVPLVKSWNCLKEKRLRAIEQVMRISQSTPGKGEQLNLEAIEALESLAGIRISIAGVGAVVSLVLPIIQLFFHKG